jgi:hypothetical protein
MQSAWQLHARYNSASYQMQHFSQPCPCLAQPCTALYSLAQPCTCFAPALHLPCTAFTSYHRLACLSCCSCFSELVLLVLTTSICRIVQEAVARFQPCETSSLAEIMAEVVKQRDELQVRLHCACSLAGGPTLCLRLCRWGCTVLAALQVGLHCACSLAGGATLCLK